jgi:hypothetical protein
MMYPKPPEMGVDGRARTGNLLFTNALPSIADGRGLSLASARHATLSLTASPLVAGCRQRVGVCVGVKGVHRTPASSYAVSRDGTLKITLADGALALHLRMLESIAHSLDAIRLYLLNDADEPDEDEE